MTVEVGDAPGRRCGCRRRGRGLRAPRLRRGLRENGRHSEPERTAALGGGIGSRKGERPFDPATAPPEVHTQGRAPVIRVDPDELRHGVGPRRALGRKRVGVRRHGRRLAHLGHDAGERVARALRSGGCGRASGFASRDEQDQRNRIGHGPVESSTGRCLIAIRSRHHERVQYDSEPKRAPLSKIAIAVTTGRIQRRRLAALAATAVAVALALLPGIASAAETGSDTGAFQRALAHGAIVALGASYVFGLATSLTPCVYPMIAITVSVFGAKEAKSRAAGDAPVSHLRRSASSASSRPWASSRR